MWLLTPISMLPLSIAPFCDDPHPPSRYRTKKSRPLGPASSSPFLPHGLLPWQAKLWLQSPEFIMQKSRFVIRQWERIVLAADDISKKCHCIVMLLQKIVVTCRSIILQSRCFIMQSGDFIIDRCSFIMFSKTIAFPHRLLIFRPYLFTILSHHPVIAPHLFSPPSRTLAISPDLPALPCRLHGHSFPSTSIPCPPFPVT